MKRFEYLRPRAIEEAFELKERYGKEAEYIAGGTDILIKIKKRAISPSTLISLRNIDKLKGIKENGELVIGSMTTLRELEKHSTIKERYPCLWNAVYQLANPQIRNMATIGGNIGNAAPSADSAPPLMVLDAELEILGKGGKRVISISDFFKGPGVTALQGGEIISAFIIGKDKARGVSSFFKLGRLSMDIAIVNAASWMRVEDNICKECRISVGAVAPTPLRLREVEEMLLGNKIDRDLLEAIGEKAEELVSPITDVRATEEYRRHMAGVLVKRVLEDAWEKAASER